MMFRRAVASDAAALAELVYTADLAHYETSGFAVSIGGSREHQLEELAKLACASAPSQFHYSHFDVAVDESGTIGASVAAFDRGADGRANERRLARNRLERRADLHSL